MPIPAIIYIRTSEDEPREIEYGLDVQRERSEEYCAAHGLHPIEVIPDDITSKVLARPGLDRAREMLADGRARAIVCSRLDRLIRYPPHLWILRDEFEREGVELHFADSGMSVDDPTARLGENIRAVIADYERELIVDKTRAAKRMKAKSGRWVGATSAPYGHQRSGKGRDAQPVIDPVEAGHIRAMAAMVLGQPSDLDPERTRPATLYEVAARLNARGVPPAGAGRAIGAHKDKRKSGGNTIWYPSTVRAVLVRRSIIGEFVYAGHVARLPALAIIDEATFTAVQAQLRKNRERASRNRKREYLLTGYAWCTCGRAIVGAAKRRAHGDTLYYRCNGHARFGAPGSDCPHRSVHAEPIERVVWAWVCALLDSDQTERAIETAIAGGDRARAPRETQLADLRQRIERGRRHMDRLLSEFGGAESGTVADALREQVRRVAAGVDRDQADAAVLARELERVTPIDAAAVRATLARARALPRAEYAQRRAIIEAIGLRCTLAVGVGGCATVTLESALIPGVAVTVAAE